jgi:hypothetical protein
MKAINHGDFPLTSEARSDEWIHTARKALQGFRSGMRLPAWLARREPGFRECHLLDRNLGPEIRRSTW